MISGITKLALSLGLTMSMGLAFVPLGCGTSEEAVFTPVHPPGHSTSRSPDVPESVEKQLRACVQQSSARFPPAEGNTYAVMFNVRASGSGRVHAVEIKDSTLGGHDVEACFAGVLQGMTLPMQDLAMRLADRAPSRPAAPHARALVANAAAPALGLAPVVFTPVVLTVFGFIIVVAIIVYVVSEASDITLDPPLVTDGQCLPCLPVPVGGTAYEYHSAAAGNDPHKGMANHTHHFRMQQSPPAAGCRCFWQRNFIEPTPDFSPLPGAVPVSPAVGGGIAP